MGFKVVFYVTSVGLWAEIVLFYVIGVGLWGGNFSFKYLPLRFSLLFMNQTNLNSQYLRIVTDNITYI